MPEKKQQDLWKLLFKYKEAQKKVQSIPLEEREKDRKKLAKWFPEWQRLTDVVADGQTLYYLIALKSKLHSKLIFDDIAPRERWRWLARIVRSGTFPVFFINSKSLKIKHFKKKEMLKPPQQKIENLSKDFRQFDPKELVIQKRITELEIESIKKKLHKLFKQSVDKKKFIQNLSLLEVQILSQMLGKDKPIKWVEILKYIGVYNGNA